MPNTQDVREPQSNDVGQIEHWQALFLRMLRNTGNVRAAAEQLGLSSQAVRRARAANPLFDQAVLDALEDAAELLEHAAFQRALAGDNLMTIFLLKGMKPDKYRENQRANTDQATQINVKTYVGWTPDAWDAKHAPPQIVDAISTQKQLPEHGSDPDLHLPAPALATSTTT